MAGVDEQRAAGHSRDLLQDDGVFDGLGVPLARLWHAYALGLRQVFPISRTAMGVIYPLWEALLCCGMCLGLLVLFRERLNSHNRWTKAMAKGRYGACLFHFPIVVLIQYMIASAVMPPFSKFLFVTATAVPLTFLFADSIRRPPLLRRVF